MKKILFFLFIIYISINPVRSDELTELIASADSGDAVSQNNLGHSYLYGNERLGVSIDLDKGIDYLNKAAEQDQVNAMTTIGWSYFLGDNGAEQNNDEAIFWNLRASNLGFSIATYNMGFFYYSGLAGLEQDLVKAKKYWLLCGSQWIEGGNNGNATPNSLLEEINFYNKNPSEEMIELRDWFIILLESLEA